MQTSVYGLGLTPFRIVFGVGVFVGIMIQYWVPSIGELFVALFKYAILSIASLIT